MFSPQPDPAELPARIPSPFDEFGPHPLARRAADELLAWLEAAGIRERMWQRGEGKMFGVLVCRDEAGRVGYLGAHSGQLGGCWLTEGLAPPVFDLDERDAFWSRGEAQLLALDERIAAATAVYEAAAAQLETARRTHAGELASLQAQHRARKRTRAAERQRLAALPGDHTQTLRELGHQSSNDRRARRELLATHRRAVAPLKEAADSTDGIRRALVAERSALSQGLLREIHAVYRIASFGGETRSMPAIFAPAEPPGGAGDCAGPKLLAEARRRELRPLALAELWVGPPPLTGGRVEGRFYPACRGKCGPLLPFMLRGLPVEPAPVYGGDEVDADEPRLRYQDPWLLVVDKPANLLSVPGRGAALRDSVLTRVQARYRRGDDEPLLAHRLDLDTSGLLLVARTRELYVALQAMFHRREVDKRYVAWLDGVVDTVAGRVELALRGDPDDRPRQIHDPIHGKPSVTEWRVLERRGGRTRVELRPVTGRTHQLRVHAAHPQGIGAAIIGDRLYGRPSSRLLLHAEHLAFRHPITGEQTRVHSPAPF